MSETYIDPFAGAEKHPAVSFKGAAPGTTIRGKVLSAPKLVQGRNFDTGEKDTWPDGNPKMAAVTELEIDGTIYALWASKPGSMFTALAAAQTAAGTPIAPGGDLAVTFTHEEPNAKKPHLNPQKMYSAIYVPPNAFGSGVPAGDEPPF